MMVSLLVWILSILIVQFAGVQAHMQLYYPPPFNASNNPHLYGPADPYLLFPYDCCGKTTPYPCRGYLDLLGTPEGAPVAIWAAGSQQNWSIWGPGPFAGNHWGGSCQISFSVDNGTTFHVVTSYEGDCPKRNNGWTDPADQTFPFIVPADMPAGDAIFAWSWSNREQEFFMTCAAVTIAAAEPGAASGSGYGGAPSDGNEGIAFNDRPLLFVADIGDVSNGCETPHTTAELKYPNPGPDVMTGDGVYPLELPTGNCTA